MSSDTPPEMHDVRPAFIKLVNEGLANGDIKNEEISDGYHSIADLYKHRHYLTAGFFAAIIGYRPWRSRQHHPGDGDMFDDMFIVGTKLNGKMITYHIPNEFWPLFDSCKTLEHAPEKWDGHNSDDVLDRIRDWLV